MGSVISTSAGTWLIGSGRSNESGGVVFGVVVDVLGIGVALQLEAGVDRRRVRQAVGVDVVGAPAKIVVRVPVDVGGEDRDVCAGGGRGDDPGKGEERAGLSLGVEVVQARALRRGDELFVGGAGITKLVPHHPGLHVVAVRGNLHGRTRPVLVEPAQRADVLFFPAVAPQIEAVGFERVDAELGLLARFDPLGPSVAEQLMSEQAEVVRSVGVDVDLHALGAEAVFLQGRGVGAGGDVGEDLAGGPRAGFDVQVFVGEFELHVVQGDVAFVADVAD